MTVSGQAGKDEITRKRCFVEIVLEKQKIDTYSLTKGWKSWRNNFVTEDFVVSLLLSPLF